MNVEVQINPQNVTITPNELHVTFNAPSVGAQIGSSSVGVSAETPTMTIEPKSQIIRDTGDIPVYQGEYEVTPSQQEQVLSTQNYLLTANVVVKPIPSNYGLITWNGSTITVS